MTSKSFGYALSSVLYLSQEDQGQKTVQLKDIARQLKAPKYFLGKIMMQLVKSRILDSLKGPTGGFSANIRTRSTSLLEILKITDGVTQFDTCILKLKKCDNLHKCPLHDKVIENRNQFLQIFSGTTVADLLKKLEPVQVNGMVRS